MKVYITIDGGTTNTRISLVKDGDIIATDKYNVGAKASIDGNAKLKQTVKDGISKILAKTGIDAKSVIRIIASGMITCEFGLVNLPHITAPCGIKELKQNAFDTFLPEISEIPFTFIRGVKTVSEDLEKVDMMRGEESELMGIIQEGKCAYVLPGSHSKIIFTDDNGNITDFATLLTGELIYAISTDTILKDAIDLTLSRFDKEYLAKGYEYCKKNGINEALFKVRILKNLLEATPQQCYGFFLGIALCGEIDKIIKANAPTVVIGGKKQLKEATAYLLEKYSDSIIKVLSDEEVDCSSSFGVIKVYEYQANV
ncbi:MAG: 2-dehydro-3-deoxygalactonokinase [Clostridia bacterium]|nr:2-dehydro-3-deoxygalactonokinase [Clostridia bacterium]